MIGIVSVAHLSCRHQNITLKLPSYFLATCSCWFTGKKDLTDPMAVQVFGQNINAVHIHHMMRHSMDFVPECIQCNLYTPVAVKLWSIKTSGL